MEPGRARDQIVEWLAGDNEYDVVTGTDPSGLPECYDVCLLDSEVAERCFDSLVQRRNGTDAYLPHLLLADDEDALAGLSAGRGDLIDELLTLPVGRETLLRHVENLLATRRASLSLAESERKYRQLIELTPEAILLVDNGRIRYANEAAVGLFGADKSVLMGGSTDRFVPESEASTLADVVASVPDLGDGATGFTELTLVDARGREIEAEVAAVAVTYERGEAIQLLVRDLTESRRQAERLRLFGRAIEAAAHGIVIADARIEDTPMVYANSGFCRITGYSLGELLGRNCRFLQGENTDPEAVAQLRHAVEAGEPTTVDLLNYRKDGTAFWNRVEITPIRDQDGELTHFLGSQRDITDRMRNEQRLTVLDRILRHNVRNKTNVIRGYADAIIAGEEPPDVAASRIRTAADELYTISEQIREFDDVVRDIEGATELVALDAIVGEGVAALRQEYTHADVQFRASGATTVAAHSTLRAALHDLLFQLGDTEQPNAEITLVREGDEVRLEVVDFGGAIPCEDLELVSTRVETPLEHLQGLELWLLRWAVEQSDGEFSVELDPEAPRIRMRFPAAERELRDS
jgi:PAS domain S-box-containing protein